MLDVFMTQDSKNFDKAAKYFKILVNSFRSIRNKTFFYKIVTYFIRKKYVNKTMKKFIGDLMFKADVVRNAMMSIIRNKDDDEMTAATKLLIRIFKDTSQ